MRGGLRPGAVGVVDRGRAVEPHDDLDVVRQQPLGVRLGHRRQVGEHPEGQRLADGALAARLRRLDEMAQDGGVVQRLALLALQLEGQGRRRALQRELDDAFGGLGAHVGAAAVATAVGARGRAAPRERDDVDVRAAPHVAVALRDPRRQRVEIEPVADDSLALEIGEARMPFDDAAGEHVGELALAQQGPVAGVVADEHAARDASPAKESQSCPPRCRSASRLRLCGSTYPTSSSAAWRRRAMVSCSTWLQKACATVCGSWSPASDTTATTASVPRRHRDLGVVRIRLRRRLDGFGRVQGPVERDPLRHQCSPDDYDSESFGLLPCFSSHGTMISSGSSSSSSDSNSASSSSTDGADAAARSAAAV